MAGLCGGGGDGGAGEARANEQARQQRIAQGMQSLDASFAGFNPDFYAKRRQDYINYAMPQLAEQSQTTQKQLNYQLANAGLRHSSVAGEQQSAFNQERARQQQAIVDAAFGQSNDLQKQVQGQKSQLVAQLQATGDPTSVANQAIGVAQNYSAPNVYQPLTGLFNNFANLYLANRIANNAQQPSTPNYGAASYASLGDSQQIRK